MNKKILEAQLNGILSHVRLASDDGTGNTLVDYVNSSVELNVTDHHLYQIELTVMDLMMQIRSEPDEFLTYPDRGCTYVVGNEAFPNIECAEDYVIELKESSHPMSIFKRETGKYITYTLVAQHLVPAKDVPE